MIKFLDFFRIVAVCATIFFGYYIGYSGTTYDPVSQLHFMIPLVILIVAGLSGLEGLLWGDKAAKEKGYEKGSNYQKQSAIAMLAVTFGAVIVNILEWGIESEISVLFVFLFFFIGSAINHAVDAIKNKNFKWQNVNRPFIMAFLSLSFLYPLIAYFAL